MASKHTVLALCVYFKDVPLIEETRSIAKQRRPYSPSLSCTRWHKKQNISKDEGVHRYIRLNIMQLPSRVVSCTLIAKRGVTNCSKPFSEGVKGAPCLLAQDRPLPSQSKHAPGQTSTSPRAGFAVKEPYQTLSKEQPLQTASLRVVVPSVFQVRPDVPWCVCLTP